MRVIGEALISVAMTVALFNFSSASAMMLTGRIQADETMSQASQTGSGQTAATAFGQAFGLRANETAEQTAARFQGKWKCMTTVVASNVPAVHAGTKVQCDLSFEKLPNGQVAASWAQRGWTPSDTTVGKCSDGTLHLSHTNHFSRGWTAHAEDYAKVIADDKMVSSSVVDQYVDGRLIGQYKTQSQLVRIDNETASAAASIANGGRAGRIASNL